MLKFECKDMRLDCDYAATAPTEEEVMDKVMAHMVEAHGEMLKKLTPEQADEINAELESVIKDDETEEIVAEDAMGDDNVEDDKDEEDAEEIVVKGVARDDDGDGEEEGEEESTEIAV